MIADFPAKDLGEILVFVSPFRFKLSQIALLTTRTCLSRVPKPLVRLGGFLGVVSSGPSPTHLDPHATLHHPQRIPFPREVESRFVRSFAFYGGQHT